MPRHGGGVIRTAFASGMASVTSCMFRAHQTFLAITSHHPQPDKHRYGRDLDQYITGRCPSACCNMDTQDRKTRRTTRTLATGSERLYMGVAGVEAVVIVGLTFGVFGLIEASLAF